VLYDVKCLLELDVKLTFTAPEFSPSGKFWGIYALIRGVRVNVNIKLA